MQPARFQTLSLPAAGAGAQPTALAIAAEVPLRVQVRNVGAVLLFIGPTSNDLTSPGGPSTETTRLPAGAVDVYVLAPRQKLYAVGAAVGGVASVHWAEALPLEVPRVVVPTLPAVKVK